ncbi:hypothetical protein FJT64_011199 [Amphibalanus amphitrite]|uniref:Uncharacterized protein n=1 Tax=Amphibalanus amphitrite TaxID=1232801 RepID=A0A6A4VBW8_AMPAM|nr:hypothetical protein FJT64_011199 [Amphibalanus amphitrite]
MSAATLCNADPNTGRRYNWIQDSDGGIYGRKEDRALGSCTGTTEVWGFQYEFVHCSTCFCLCDEDTDSARYFSLLPATADVTQNKIVTGVSLKLNFSVAGVQGLRPLTSLPRDVIKLITL